MTDTLLSELQDEKKRCVNTINSMLTKLETYSTKLKFRDHSERELAGLEITVHFLEHAKECLK